MGNGEVTGNQSVHWSIDHEDGQDLKVKTNENRRPRNGDPDNVHVKAKAYGRDPKSVQTFTVTLRFESKQDATTQLQAALGVVDAAADGGSFFLTFTVPALLNGAVRTDPDAGPRPDVGIRW